MKTIEQLGQEAKQAREDMREVMLDEFGIGATLSDRILSLMIRAVQSNIAHNDAKYEVSGNSDSCDGWIDWKGGDCPVGYHEYVSVKNRDGSICKEWQAGDLRWEYAGKNAMLNPAYDIIAYRIVK